MKAYIGIDPGAKGFVSFVEGERIGYCSIADMGMNEVARRIRDFAETTESVVAVMEEVHAVFGSSSKATFEFGKVNGVLIGILTALNIPYTMVQPKRWQTDVWINQDKEYVSKNGKRVVDTKQTSYNAAKRLFPNEDFKRTPACKKFDDNKVDSLLIAEYARRKNI